VEKELMQLTPVHTFGISVRWNDMDIQNHVNNANYFTYIEESRFSWLSGLKQAWKVGEYVPVLAKVSMNFIKPVNHPSKLNVILYAKLFDETSVMIAHKIVDKNNEDLVYATGTALLVWFDPINKKRTHVPQSVLDACSNV